MNKEYLLIHGWDPSKYNSKLPIAPEENIAWNHRSELIKLLENNAKLSYYNLPGFCGKTEPKVKNWKVSDFAIDLESWLKRNHCHPDLIIGYSFGAAVALTHKLQFKSQTPILLISPALLRSDSVWS